MRQDDDQRDEKQTLPRSGKYVGTYGLPAGLHHHVGHHHKAAYRKHDHLVTQCGNTDGNHFRIIAEQRDSILAEDDKDHSPEQKEHHADLCAEPEAFLYPIVKFCAITEAAHRLISLSEANDHAEYEHSDAVYDTHGGNGRIAIIAGNAVEGNGADTCKSLPGKGWCASGNDFLHKSAFEGDFAGTVTNHTFLSTHHEQDHESAKLPYD